MTDEAEPTPHPTACLKLWVIAVDSGDMVVAVDAYRALFRLIEAGHEPEWKTVGIGPSAFYGWGLQHVPERKNVNEKLAVMVEYMNSRTASLAESNARYAKHNDGVAKSLDRRPSVPPPRMRGGTLETNLRTGSQVFHIDARSAYPPLPKFPDAGQMLDSALADRGIPVLKKVKRCPKCGRPASLFAGGIEKHWCHPWNSLTTSEVAEIVKTNAELDKAPETPKEPTFSSAAEVYGHYVNELGRVHARLVRAPSGREIQALIHEARGILTILDRASTGL